MNTRIQQQQQQRHEEPGSFKMPLYERNMHGKDIKCKGYIASTCCHCSLLSEEFYINMERRIPESQGFQ